MMAMTAVVPPKPPSPLNAAQKQVRHSQDVLRFINRFLSLFKDTETGQRGFITTGNEGFLVPYYRATSELAAQ